MSTNRMFPLEGRMVPGESIEFEAITEPFTQYKLADGTLIKVKLVLLDASRLESFTPTGDPVYQCQFQQIIGILAPDSLKRKPQ